jgi:hypothetical protein
MCGLVEAAIGIGVANAAVGVASQAQAANEQNDYRRRLGISQNRAYQQNVEAVTKDIGLQIDQLARRDIEQANATQNELSNIARNVREASATTRTQQAVAGVEGVSADLLHLQFERDVAEFESTAMRNIRNFRNQSNMEAQAIYARGQSIINSGYPSPLPPVATINPLASIMNGITTGISVYGALSSFQTPGGITEAAGATTNINQAAPTANFNPLQTGYTPSGFFGGTAYV